MYSQEETGPIEENHGGKNHSTQTHNEVQHLGEEMTESLPGHRTTVKDTQEPNPVEG